ncbi:MAG: MFS transporter [Promethearchaeota archaeon]
MVTEKDLAPSLLPINVTNWLSSFAAIIPFVVIPLYARTYLGATLFQASIIIGTLFGVTSISSVIMGSLSDELGRRKPFLILSMAGSAAVFLIIPLAGSSLQLILLMAVFGFISAGFVPCIMGLVSEISSKTEKGKNMGLLNTTTSLGWAIGSLLSGFIVDLFNFTIAFYVGSILAVLTVLLALAYLKETKSAVGKDRDLKKAIIALKKRFSFSTSGEGAYLKENGLNWFYFSAFLRYCAYWGSFALLTIFFASLVSTTWIGILLMINMGLQGFLMTPIGKLSDKKLGRKPIILFGLFGTTVVLSLYALSYSLYLLIAAQILNAFVFACIYTGGSAFVSDISPKFKHNEAMGYLNSSITLGAVTGTIIAGFMAELFGLRTMFFILAILPILGAIIILLKVSETISITKYT